MKRFLTAIVLIIALGFWGVAGFKGDSKNKVIEETCVQETCVVVTEFPSSYSRAYYEVIAIVDAKGYREVRTRHNFK